MIVSMSGLGERVSRAAEIGGGLRGGGELALAATSSRDALVGVVGTAEDRRVIVEEDARSDMVAECLEDIEGVLE